MCTKGPLEREIAIDLLGACNGHSMLLRCVAALLVPWPCEPTEVSLEVVARALRTEGYAAFCARFGAAALDPGVAPEVGGTWMRKTTS